MTNPKSASSLPIPVASEARWWKKYLKENIFNAEVPNILFVYRFYLYSRKRAHKLETHKSINISVPALMSCCAKLGRPEEVSASPAQVRWDDSRLANTGFADHPENGFWDNLGPAASPWKQLHPQVSHDFTSMHYSGQLKYHDQSL